jgi:hypothetical protein
MENNDELLKQIASLKEDVKKLRTLLNEQNRRIANEVMKQLIHMNVRAKAVYEDGDEDLQDLVEISQADIQTVKLRRLS